MNSKFVPPSASSPFDDVDGKLTQKELRKAFKPLEREGWVRFNTLGDLQVTSKYRFVERLWEVADTLTTVALNAVTFAALWWLVGATSIGKLLAEATSTGWNQSNLWLLGVMLSLGVSSITMHKTSTYFRVKFRNAIANKIDLDV